MPGGPRSLLGGELQVGSVEIHRGLAVAVAVL